VEGALKKAGIAPRRTVPPPSRSNVRNPLEQVKLLGLARPR
jgi:hypothetical protein